VTPTVTQTPTPSPVLPPALLFIQPDDLNTGSIVLDIVNYLNNLGNAWTGFGSDGGVGPAGLGTTYPTTDVVNWMNMYATSGVTGLPAVQQLTITKLGNPNNLVDPFNIPVGTVPTGGIYGTGSASHAVLIPISTLSDYETEFLQGTSLSYGTTLTMEPSIYYNGGAAVINYTGSTYANTTYRMYFVSNMGGLTNTNTWYYKGSKSSLTP
jgi:hypothetical protein